MLDVHDRGAAGFDAPACGAAVVTTTEDLSAFCG
jgi:hypothetical protein